MEHFEKNRYKQYSEAFSVVCKYPGLEQGVALSLRHSLGLAKRIYVTTQLHGT
jgi:hypothetical protein